MDFGAHPVWPFQGSRFPGQDCNLHICIYKVLADTSEVKPFEVALPVLVIGCGSHYTVPVFP